MCFLFFVRRERLNRFTRVLTLDWPSRSWLPFLKHYFVSLHSHSWANLNNNKNNNTTNKPEQNFFGFFSVTYVVGVSINVSPQTAILSSGQQRQCRFVTTFCFIFFRFIESIADLTPLFFKLFCFFSPLFLAFSFLWHFLFFHLLCASFSLLTFLLSLYAQNSSSQFNSAQSKLSLFHGLYMYVCVSEIFTCNTRTHTYKTFICCLDFLRNV